LISDESEKKSVGIKNPRFYNFNFEHCFNIE